MLLRWYDADTNGSAVTHYAMHDAQFNITGLIASDGSVVERYEYTAYGQRTVLDADFTADADGQSDLDFQLGHQGLMHDRETGLIHNRNRMRHPTLGRFIQRDPLVYVDGGNLYEYVRSRPTALSDSRGTRTDETTYLRSHMTLRVRPNNPVGMPWLPGTNRDRYFDAWGWTRLLQTIDCECRSCDVKSQRCLNKGSRDTYVHCDISLVIRIFIDVEATAAEPSITIKGAYGHEQRHVQNILRALSSSEMLAKLNAASQGGAKCQSTETCKSAGIHDAQAMIELVLERQVVEPEIHHMRPTPLPGTGYPPLGGIMP